MSPRPTSDNELGRDQILEAARERFFEFGYRAVSMRALAQSLGCSHGAIYYHFKDKAELYYRVIEQDFDRLREVLELTIAGKPPSPQLLREILIGYIQFGLERPQSYESMFMLNDTELECHRSADQMRCYKRFSETVQVCLDRVGKEGDSIAWMLFLGLHGFVSNYVTLRIPYEEIEHLAAQYADFLFKGTGL